MRKFSLTFVVFLCSFSLSPMLFLGVNWPLSVRHRKLIIPSLSGEKVSNIKMKVGKWRKGKDIDGYVSLLDFILCAITQKVNMCGNSRHVVKPFKYFNKNRSENVTT